MRTTYIIGVVAGVGGIILSAISHNWQSMVWAMAATAWTLKAWFNDNENRWE